MEGRISRGPPRGPHSTPHGGGATPRARRLTDGRSRQQGFPRALRHLPWGGCNPQAQAVRPDGKGAETRRQAASAGNPAGPTPPMRGCGRQARAARPCSAYPAQPAPKGTLAIPGTSAMVHGRVQGKALGTVLDEVMEQGDVLGTA